MRTFRCWKVGFEFLTSKVSDTRHLASDKGRKLSRNNFNVQSVQALNALGKLFEKLRRPKFFETKNFLRQRLLKTSETKTSETKTFEQTKNFSWDWWDKKVVRQHWNSQFVYLARVRTWMNEEFGVAGYFKRFRYLANAWNSLCVCSEVAQKFSQKLLSVLIASCLVRSSTTWFYGRDHAEAGEMLE